MLQYSWRRLRLPGCRPAPAGTGRRRTKVKSGACQKYNFSPNCTLRDVLIVEVTIPPDAKSMLEPGAEKLGEFVRLNASARNCRRVRSLNWNCLNSERSRFLKRPSRRMLPPLLP